MDNDWKPISCSQEAVGTLADLASEKPLRIEFLVLKSQYVSHTNESGCVSNIAFLEVISFA